MNRMSAFFLGILLATIGFGETVLTVPDAAHLPPRRASAGVPSIECSHVNGRLWRTYYAAEHGCEGAYDYAVLATSTDDGKTWKDVAIADPDGNGPWRAFDPEIWIAPDGKLWWLWTERTARPPAGQVAVQTDKLMSAVFDAENEPTTLPPTRQIGTGIVLTKPIVDSKGRWIFATSHWSDKGYDAKNDAGVTVSEDGGRTFSEIGALDVPFKERSYAEHAIFERKDGVLQMVLRNGRYGWATADSADGGLTWTDYRAFSAKSCNTRTCVRRLKSGNLIMVKHGAVDRRPARYDLTAYISKDDAKTWEGGLVLDCRMRACYPDVCESKDGHVYITWDFDRSGRKEFMVAKLTEDEILRGRRDSTEPGPAGACKVLDKYVASGEIKGAVAMILEDVRETVHCAGDAATNRFFWIASMTKGVTAAAVYQLQDRGKLNVNDPIDKYLPEMKALGKVPTIRQCLAQSGGFKANTPGMEADFFAQTLAERCAEAAATKQAYAPQSQHLYSNIGIDVCARIVEVVSGQKFEDFLQKNVFDPLGMKEATFFPTDEQIARLQPVVQVQRGKPYESSEYHAITNLSARVKGGRWHAGGSGGLFSTAGDIFRFYKMLANDGKAPDGTRLLSHKSILALSTSAYPYLDRYSQGLRAYPNDWFGHGGALQTLGLADWRHNRAAVLLVQHVGDWYHPYRGEFTRALGGFPID